MEITLRTLTPLWTGGVETGKMDRIHETGIIGSLRWWYEVIVRGLGGDVCNPTSEGPNADRCPRDDDSYCDVCQLFGATGKSRRFRLRLQEGTPLFIGDNVPLPSGRIHTHPFPRAGSWYLQSQAQMGNKLGFQITSLGSEDDVALLLVPLALIHRHASLSAKGSNGYGVVSLTQSNQAPVTVDAALLDRFPSGTRPSGPLPDLRDFFFAKLQFQEPKGKADWWQNIKGIAEARAGRVTDGGRTVGVYDNRDPRRNTQRRDAAMASLQAVVQSGVLPIAPAVRNWLRFQWFPTLFRSGRAPVVLEQYLFGRTGGQGNIGSKIEVSHAYTLDHGQWEFRIWGWIPCVLPDDIRLDRRRFLTDLQTALGDPVTWQWVMGGPSPVCTITDWHALDCDDRNGRRYLEELLGLPQGGA